MTTNLRARRTALGTCLWLAAALLLSSPRSAAADDARALLHAYSMTTSAFFEGGATDYSAFRANYGIAPYGTGIRYTERNGIISGTLAAVVLIFVKAAGSVSTVKSSRSYDEGGYRYYETTYYTEAEKDERRARVSRTGGAQAGLLPMPIG